MYSKKLLKRIYKLLFNQQYKIQYFCEYIGSENKIKHKFLKRYMRKWLARKYHIIIGFHAIIGKNIIMPHPQNIVIGEGAVIGNNVTIYQDVTIDAKEKNSVDIYNLQSCYPRICNNVCIYSGAKIIGNACVKENSIIGNNAVVIENTEKNGVYAGVPATLIKKREDSDNLRGGARILILNNAATTYYFPYICTEYLDVRKAFSYKRYFLPLRIFNRIVSRMEIFYGSILGEWYEEIDKYKKIIVFDNAWNSYLNKCLSKYRGKKILYIWNPAEQIFSHNNINKLKSVFDNIYSFDKQDCKKYQISYFHSVYTSQILSENKKMKYDICFIGADKGRTKKLKQLYKLFCTYNLKCRFYISSEDKKEQEERWSVDNTWISYEKYLEWVFASRCILDFPQNGQEGFTMRVLESAFLNKKLITKNGSIKKSDLYKKENIFIIGQDKWEKLYEFINSNTIPYDKEILEKYDIENWAENIE